MSHHRLLKLWNWAPTVGIVLFAAIFYYSTLLYPGGTRFDTSTDGFHWLYSYLCDLLEQPAKNGVYNTAMIAALSSLTALIIALASFFVQYANIYCRDRRVRLNIKTYGPIGMFLIILTATSLHDYIIGIASAFGLVGLIYMMKDMRHNRLNGHLNIAYLIGVLVLFNNVIFYIYGTTGSMILPISQKVAIGIALIWVLWFSSEMRAYSRLLIPSSSVGR